MPSSLPVVPAHPLLTLQEQAGNQAVLELLRTGAIRAKLAISQPDDPEEREADEVAERIVRMPSGRKMMQPKCACGGLAGSDGECEECHKKRFSVQREAENSESGGRVSSSAPPIVHEALRLPGQPLDSDTRLFMESRFGTDFNHVRTHTDGPAAESARAVNARAYTVGQNVVFAAGQYSPGTTEGGRLLAHELTHTIQQGGMGSALGDVRRALPTGRSQPSIDNITRRLSVLLQRSWIGDRIDWVSTAIRESNWAGSVPPGAYYVLNGLSMDDMVNVIRALSSTDRKKLSDNLDEEAGGFDRSRLQLALSIAAAPVADKAFQEQSENLLSAIRAGNFATPPDGAFLLLVATSGAPRDHLLSALNRDALDELIAHRDEASSVPGGADVLVSVNQARSKVGPTKTEQRLLDLLYADPKTFFTEFNALNETDQMRFLRGNTAPGAQIMNKLRYAEGISDVDHIRYLVEKASTVASQSLYVDASVRKYIWHPKYRIGNPEEYSRFILFGDLFEVELDINTISDRKLTDDEADRQFREAKPGPGGFLWPADRNQSTLPILWQVKMDVRKQMETLLFDKVLRAGILVIQYLLNVVFPVVQGAAIRSLAALRGASVGGVWMQGSKVLKGSPAIMSDAEAFTNARNARNTMVDAYNAMSKAQREQIATVTGGVNVETGQVAGGYNTAGKCAEDMVVERLGGDASKIRFSEAVRPRTGQQQPVCVGCQGKFVKEQFPEGVIYGGPDVKMPGPGQ
jgi:hypothetical protein